MEMFKQGKMEISENIKAIDNQNSLSNIREKYNNERVH
jgi:hypothetical protein